MDRPIIKIELEGLSQQVRAMLVTRNEEINKIIEQTLEQQLSEDWVIARIDAAVRDALSNGIRAIADHPYLRDAITDAIATQVADRLRNPAGQ